MKKLIYAAVAAVALVSSPAGAFTWNGWHWGIHGGGAWGNNTATDINGYNTSPGHAWNYNSNGLIGGIQLGCNRVSGAPSLCPLLPAPPPSWLFGYELDLGYMGLSGSGADPLSPAGDTVAKTKSDFYAAFRGRIGHFWSPAWLTYITAGVIGINTKVSVTDACNTGACGGGLTSGSNTSFRPGWTAGGGIEYAPSGSPVSYRLEWLYFDIGSVTFSGSLSGANYNWRVRTTGNILRFAINF